MPNNFTPGAAMTIAYKSVTTTTGSAEPVRPTDTLAQYNAVDPDLPSIRDRILNDTGFGLPHYERTMNPNALKDMSTGWTLQKLADLIFDESEPAQVAPQSSASAGEKGEQAKTPSSKR